MFFHATETIKHNKSFIMTLKNNDGLEVIKHEDKATILWEAFRDILGSSDFTHMHFNLEDLIQTADSLDELVQPILKEEIDNIVKNLLSGKSPGPDDFNIYYGKKCWDIIVNDFYEMCNAFYNENICLQSINGSYIILLPKVYNPTKVGGYRPISLLNSSIKLIIKILANRLQSVILKLVHQNQYGFIKNISIQDCLAWSFKYLHICHKSKKRNGHFEVGF
jgi:hypothetical protein